MYSIFCVYCTFAILFIAPGICSTWPTNAAYGCTASGGGWVSMNDSLRESDFIICEKMCSSQGTNGCCYLSNAYGCYWKQDAEVSQGASDNGLAVTCSQNSK